MKMDKAETLIETHPDSSFSLLKTIDKNSLRSKADKARYALLMSMALDKNYIDTTTFAVLQPAIDYYLKKGNPDQKLRTYYYQGIIYLNQGDRDKALNSFFKGEDISNNIHDSLTLARDYVAQGMIYNQFYDSDTSTDYNLKAASIYNKLSDKNKEFDCLLRAISGATQSGNKSLSDSILNLLYQFKTLDNTQERDRILYKLSYLAKFGTENEIRDILNTHSLTLTSPTDLMNMAHIYNKIGDHQKALNLLESLNKNNTTFDTLRYLSLSVKALIGLENYKEALSVYQQYNAKHSVIDFSKFDQKMKSIEEKHQLEIAAQEKVREKSRIIWICVSGIIFLTLGIIILFLLIRSHKHQKYIAIQQSRNSELENERLRSEKELAIQQAKASKSEKELAVQQAKTSELENEKLKSEKELAVQQAKITDLENEKLKSEKELAVQQAKIADLENERLRSEKERLSLDNLNLQLERDKKTLEAENLSHKVDQLKDERESLKHLIAKKKDLPEEVKTTLQTRMEMLNALLAGYITNNAQLEKPYDTWVKDLTDNTEAFMNSNRLAFQASHPNFIKYFEEHGLTDSEINYVCLYAIGLKGKEVGHYMKRRSHVNTSSLIRKKLGIDKYETNIGIYVRKLLTRLYPRNP